MLEVEMKFRVADWAPVLAQVQAWGGVADAPRVDRDSYFNAPDRDFAVTDEAVRVRSIGPTNRLTYKGPKLDVATKTRKEIEVPLADGDAAARLAGEFLTSLGYKPVAVVSKRRQVYHLTRGGFALEVCFDDAGAIGRFVELEIQAEPADFEAAKRVLLQTAAELGLTEQERRSYLRMHLGE